MKTIAVFALGLGLLGWAGLGTRADDKKDDKAASKLEGKYTLVGGKKNGGAIDEDAKKAEYTVTAEKITIKGKDMTFVMGYKLDAKASPNTVDMEILEGPEGTKGSKAYGIVELKDGMLKLAYAMEKDKRPKNFEGKDGMMFEFKKAK
jgi:uncharacterized protein (TIGR03067 family)